MANTGAVSPGTGASATGIGSVAWSNPSNAVSSNNFYATAALTKSSNTSNWLKGTNFDFVTGVTPAIENTATIDGIVVEIEQVGPGTGLYDNSLKIVDEEGTIGGTDHATATLWGAEGYVSHGSSTDAWGLTLTGADVLDSSFGAALSVRLTGTTSQTASVDHIRMTVYYTNPSGTTGQAAGLLRAYRRGSAGKHYRRGG